MQVWLSGTSMRTEVKTRCIQQGLARFVLSKWHGSVTGCLSTGVSVTHYKAFIANFCNADSVNIFVPASFNVRMS